MYPMLFMERFWRGEPKKELFVAMPFHEKLKPRFSEIIKQSAKKIGLRAYTSEEKLTSDAIFSRILDGIANSKMVLCDLSDDPGLHKKGYANGNVLYEAGIARTIREQHEVVLIREQSPSTIKNFDVKHSMINSPSPEKITKPWLVSLLTRYLQEIKLAETERIRVIAESLDGPSLELIIKHGAHPRPNGQNNFVLNMNAPTRYWIAVHRLINLGVLRLNTARKTEESFEYSYWWTSLLKPLIDHLKIRQLPK